MIPYIKKSSDKSSLYVFMPPAYHDNTFLTTKNIENIIEDKNFIIETAYNFSLPSILAELLPQEIKINSPENQMFKKIPNKKQDQNYHIKSSLTGLALGVGIGGGFIAFSKKNPKFTQNKFLGKKYFLALPIIGAAAGYGYGKYRQKFSDQE
jgi:hypothetical protein